MGALSQLDPSLRGAAEEFVRILTAAGLSPKITSVRRSYAKQKQLYDRWRSGRSPYPAAVPGTSKHERGLAFDLVLNDSRWLTAAGQLWESWGGRWGGRFKDPIHFEHP